MTCREQQLDEHVRGQDRVGPQRRRAQPLEDPALAIDRHDRDQRQHGARGDQKRREDRQIDRDEARDVGRPALRTRGPSIRPSTTKISTGMPTVPMTPIGSRTKILISSQVSPRVRAAWSAASVANRVTGQLEKDVLERRQLGAEVDHADPMLRQALDDLGHEIVAAAANRDLLRPGC